MNNMKFLILVIFILLNTGCYSKGPTVRIETQEPAEDFVLICDWHTDSLLNFFSSSVLSKRIIHVVNSGEETPCGVAWMGGRPNVRVDHPVYWEGTKNEEDGLTVYHFTGTKLDYLDKQKEKFEAGYWDKHPDPGFAYANNLTGCDFPHQYFDYYRKVKNVDREHFKRLYYQPITNCLKIMIPILKKYRGGEYGSFPDAEYYIDKIWNPITWRKYNE